MQKLKKKIRILKSASLIVTSVFVLISISSCSLLPKKEISESELNSESAKAYQDFKSKNKISSNQAWNQIVQRVAQRIAKASGENFQWEVVLVENPEVNAWCMPGGKIAVYTGIMPVLKTEAALAAVMGHEVAHATLRHGKKVYSRAIEEQQTALIVAGAAIIGGQLLCETENCKKLSQVGGAAAGLALSFFNRKFSREDESEADRAGQVYLAKAGYEPRESLALWDRMAASHGGSAPPEWMSTHPSDSHRKESLSSWLPGAEAEYQRSSVQYGLGEMIK